MDELEVENRVRELIAIKDVREAAGLALYGSAENGRYDGHGVRVFGYLRAIMKNDRDAKEVFAKFSRLVHKDIGSCPSDGSLKSWLYGIAYRVMVEHMKERKTRCDFQFARTEQRASHARASIDRWDQSSVKDVLRELCSQLPENQQTIFILRVDRNMDWEELARVFLNAQEFAEPEILQFVVCHLKTQFNRAKEKVHTLAAAKVLLVKKC
jgi:RNA polymerase sigma-70 factor (ECF subfamily)